MIFGPHHLPVERSILYSLEAAKVSVIVFLLIMLCTVLLSGLAGINVLSQSNNERLNQKV